MAERKMDVRGWFRAPLQTSRGMVASLGFLAACAAVSGCDGAIALSNDQAADDASSSLSRRCRMNPSACQSSNDSGSTVVDAGSSVVDAGSSVVDAGSSVVDAGSSVVDAGSSVVDAGSSVVDAGSSVVDAGSSVVDAGSSVVDAGSNVVDAGWPSGKTFYVSKTNTGTIADGRSWTTAWKELNQIAWSALQPGDLILIDGGPNSCASNYDFANHAANRPGLNCGMLYTTQLNVQKSGTASAPITIKLASESGRNGTVVIFGGRTSALPYCTQNYTPSGSARSAGIVFNTRAAGASHVVIDGTRRSGIMIYGAETGIDLISDATSFVTLRNLEIFDNGTYAPYSGGGHSTDNPGIFLDGHDIVIDRVLIHDNGQDEIQDGYTGAPNSHLPINNVTVSNSWLYNRRDHPSWIGYPFSSGAESGTQDCTHVDGIQIWGGGTNQLNLVIEDTVFGPLLGQDIYPSDTNTSFNNVVIRNVLHINPLLHPVGAEPIGSNTGPTPGGWKISDMTTYLTPGVNTGTPSHGFGLWGSGHSLTNSIFYYGYFAYAPSFTGTVAGNIYYGGEAVPGGVNMNPLFSSIPAGGNSPNYAQLAAGDFTPNCSGCSTKGSSLHKVQDILDRIDALNR